MFPASRCENMRDAHHRHGYEMKAAFHFTGGQRRYIRSLLCRQHSEYDRTFKMWSSSEAVDTAKPQNGVCRGLRTDAAEMAVAAAHLIVEHFDVI
jgi:hypothetical protein